MTNAAEKLAAFASATNNDLYDPDFCGKGIGEWMVEAVQTHETLAQFEEASSRWAECSGIQRGEFSGLPYVCWSKIQNVRGAQRRSMWVIDFGDFRMAIDADARYYC